MQSEKSELRDQLAFRVHEYLCGQAPDCSRYRGDTPHYTYYEQMSQSLIAGLEPLVGIANVLPVVKVVMEETGL